MPRIKSRQFETFGDGLLTICGAEERNLTETKAEHIRYGIRTVGVSRFWQARTAGNKVDKLLSIPMSVLGISTININDVVLLEDEIDRKGSTGQYQILQIQQKYDAEPPVLYLSLEKANHSFKDRRNGDGD